MNEFTKEELQYIKSYIFYGAASIRYEHHEILRNKIQSMIDDYCEHEWYAARGKNNFGYPKCSKCGTTKGYQLKTSLADLHEHE